MKTIMPRKRLILPAIVFGTLVVVLILTLTGQIFAGESEVISQPPEEQQIGVDTSVQDSTVLESEMTNRLVEAGLDVSSIEIQGTSLRVLLTSDALTADNAIKHAILGMNLCRIASEAGMTWIDIVVNVGGEQTSAGHGLAQLDVVPHVTADSAATAIATWVGAIEAETGVHATYGFEGYRLDVNVDGSMEALEAAAEDFMAGGFALHRKGQLDLLTVVAKSETGDVIFEGVADYLLATTSYPYMAPGFDANW